ncbi:MAG: hypothetical protein M0Z52_13945 [Actinomycetota bacterium]|nr:hypothetical protein [Actinomycetota bacterium]
MRRRLKLRWASPQRLKQGRPGPIPGTRTAGQMKAAEKNRPAIPEVAELAVIAG